MYEGERTSGSQIFIRMSIATGPALVVAGELLRRNLLALGISDRQSGAVEELAGHDRSARSSWRVAARQESDIRDAARGGGPGHLPQSLA